MPSLDQSFLTLLQDDYTRFPCFIETGTAEGKTIFAMEPLFPNLYTIEYSPKYYSETKSKYNGAKIEFILGDSSVVFTSLLPQITDKCIFFLDGHWSSGDTGRSTKDCPLVEEITHINDLFVNEAIIIIDDYRLFGLDSSSGILQEDWSNISKNALLNIIGPRVNKVYHLDSEISKEDRLIIHINSR